MSSTRQQFSLQLYLPKHCSFENFIDKDNETAVHCLQDVLTDPDNDHTIFLWGAKNSGKSHLLAAACHWAGANFYTSVYVPLISVKQYGALILDELSTLYCIAIDDINSIVGDLQWETRLFHLMNQAAQSNTKIILCASNPPKTLSFKLPDLKSRMCAAVIFQLRPLDEDGKRIIMMNYAKEHGLILSREVLNYILHHEKRSISHLLEVMEKIDKISLSEHRRLTIPFIKKVLFTK